MRPKSIWFFYQRIDIQTELEFEQWVKVRLMKFRKHHGPIFRRPHFGLLTARIVCKLISQVNLEAQQSHGTHQHWTKGWGHRKKVWSEVTWIYPSNTLLQLNQDCTNCDATKHISALFARKSLVCSPLIVSCFTRLQGISSKNLRSKPCKSSVRRGNVFWQPLVVYSIAEIIITMIITSIIIIDYASA